MQSRRQEGLGKGTIFAHFFKKHSSAPQEACGFFVHVAIHDCPEKKEKKKHISAAYLSDSVCPGANKSQRAQWRPYNCQGLDIVKHVPTPLIHLIQTAQETSFNEYTEFNFVTVCPS